METTDKGLGVWHQFLIVLGLAISAPILTAAALPLYRWMDDAAIIPILVALFYVAPAICLAALIVGAVGSYTQPHSRWSTTAKAGGIAFGVMLLLLGWVFGVAFVNG